MPPTTPLKIIVSGPGGVGKTTLLLRYQTGEYHPAKTTIGVNFVTQQVDTVSGLVILSIWDYAGEERFKALFPGYCSGSSGGFAVFDMSRPDTLNMLSDWIEIIFEKNELIPVLLVGTKKDAVSPEQLEYVSEKAREFATDHSLKGFYLVSSQTGEGIPELFDALANAVLETIR